MCRFLTPLFSIPRSRAILRSKAVSCFLFLAFCGSVSLILVLISLFLDPPQGGAPPPQQGYPPQQGCKIFFDFVYLI
jgi:hypothetical protein